MSEMDRKIRDTRKRLRMTQGDFASALGVTQSTVSRWESGAQSPDFAATVKLAELVGTDPFEFVGSEPRIAKVQTTAAERKIYVTGCIAENAYSSEPDVGSSDFVIMNIQAYAPVMQYRLEAFEIIDESGFPCFGVNSIVIVAKEYGSLIKGDFVVITVSDNSAGFRTMIKKAYTSKSGAIKLASLNPDPVYYSVFDLISGTAHSTTSKPFSVDSSCIRGVVIASLTKHNPDRFEH